MSSINILRSILPLYPDVEDKKRKWVMHKVKSGTGWLKGNLWVTVQLLGFYHYHWVPNTIFSLEIDQYSGPFETFLNSNLEFVTEKRFDSHSNPPWNLQPWIIGLLENGGVDPETIVLWNTMLLKIGFQKGNIMQLGKRWETTFTRKFFPSPKVWWDLVTTMMK